MPVIDGEQIAEDIESELKEINESPKLSIVLAGDNPASRTFIDEKMEAADRLGFKAELEEFGSDTGTQELLDHVERLNNDSDVHGILVQLPLPNHIDNHAVFEKLRPEKDVDGLTPENIGGLLRGNPDLKPAAVTAIETILGHESIDVRGKDAVIVNNSALIGRPLSMVLTRKGATVTLCHEYTEELGRHTSAADIVVTATGEKGVLTPEMVREGAVVIDAGYHNGEGDIEQVEEFTEKTTLSAVPNGLGPVTVAETMRNLVKCYRKQR